MTEAQTAGSVAETGAREADKKPDILVAIKNLAHFFGSVGLWCLRHPVMAIGLVLIAFWLIFGRACSPFENFTKSRDLIEAEARQAERIGEIRAKTGAAALEIHAEFNRAANRIDHDLAQGREEIEDSSHALRDVLLAWAGSDQRLCASAGGCGSPGP